MKNLFVLLITGFLIAGCSHTNELAKFNVNGSSMLYKEFVGRDAGTIQIAYPKSGTQTNKKEDKGILDAIASIGTELLNADKTSDIKEWVDTRAIAEDLSYGMENNLKEYINVKRANSIDDNPAFIVETTLERCVLNVTDNGVTLQVQSYVKILERGTGSLVWEDSESETVPINYDAYGSSNKKTSTESKILTAVQLNSLSKKEVNACIEAAVQSVGRLMGETFREDLAEASKKK